MINQQELYRERESGIKRGLWCGFTSLDEYYTFKQSYPLVVYGLPGSGKSEWVFELLINLSQFYQKQHFLFTPESGTSSQVTNILIGKYIGKPVNKFYDVGKRNEYAMSDEEYQRGLEWVKRYFCIVDVEDFNTDQITISDVYALANEMQFESGWSFDTITIDPKAELHMELDKTNGREDFYLGLIYNKMREDGEKKSRTTILVEHVRDKKPLYDKSLAISYHTPPLPTEMAGGQMHFRKGYNIICIYRPQHEIFNCFENEVWVMVQKVKPRGVGKIGIVKQYYDWQKEGRYYEIHNQQIHYATERTSMDMARPHAEPDEEAPF